MECNGIRGQCAERAPCNFLPLRLPHHPNPQRIPGEAAVNNTPAYAELAAVHARLHRLGHAVAMLSWDRAAMMPPGGSAARAAGEVELRGLIQGMRRDPRIAELLRRADDEPLDELSRADLREMRRDWREASALPESLVAARTLAGARCEHAWRRQRPDNDWRGYLENFHEVLHLAREEALRLSEATGLAPYDALLDRYEPGMTAAELDRLFGALRQWLPEFVAHTRARQCDDRVVTPPGPFPVAGQRALCAVLLERLGFDLSAGRLDESAHPFTGGVPEDVRLTCRYREDDFLPAVRTVLHEAGHARYNQGLPRAWLGRPVGRPRSFGIHESQSLYFEMQLGRSRAFLELLPPLLRAHLGQSVGFDADNLVALFTRVAPGQIRVEADEASYPLHIVLRYEIERALIGGEAEAEDIPDMWDERMMALFGIDTRGDYRDGCLQDVHWADGSFGYFPSYALGAMYAAQWAATMADAVTDLEARVAGGDLQPVFDWLAEHIWSQASRFETDELVRRASGGPLDPTYFRRHLERRYGG